MVTAAHSRTAMVLASIVYMAGAAMTIPASDPRVYWTSGRYTRGSDASVSFDWPGVGGRLNVTGATFVTMTVQSTETGPTRFRTWQLNQGYYFPESTIWIRPGVQNVTLAVGSGAIAFANNVAPQFYSTASGKLIVLSFTTDGVFVGVTRASRRLEFVGDSITAATNIVNPGGIQCADGGFQSDWGISWSSQLCTMFDAECSTVAVGGKGLVRNCCDSGERMPQYYQQLNYQPNGVLDYNFSNGFTPDAVVVYLGTNDYAAGGSPTLDAEFTAAYVAFMHNVTAWYNDSSITFFCTVGPMSPTLPLNATLAAVSQANAEGLRAVFLNVTAAFEYTGGHYDGCAGHPGIIGHSMMALLAKPQMSAAMNW